ncbi:odv-ec43 [Hyphantria cunea granulovirus]|uniref:Odv-ec43 n=1 Tax=Hyphantria cunea granulovirus TaxID=307448 RepID=A0AAF1D270_9BBAC|nr:odv-ec43 [Hyphantria cunea granulovirus]QBQ01597.1 odv-ec43 [Hyphantria cunea granulovirus]
MACPSNIKVFISDSYVLFPYTQVTPEVDVGGGAIRHLTIFVPTIEDEYVINKELLVANGFTDGVLVFKHVPNFQTDEYAATGTVVYWNVISPIYKLGLGTTKVFNVVLSDNLFYCGNITINDAYTANVQCPLQVDYELRSPTETRTYIVGELAGDTAEQNKIANENNTNFLICFLKDTPMGIKILNVKRYLILLSQRRVRAKFCVYLTAEELAVVQKELSWESTRRLIRHGKVFPCSILNRPSYKYVVDALELMGIDNTSMASLYTLVNTFQPLVMRYNLVPDIFIQLNHINKNDKHVRLYCKNSAVAITNAGLVPINLPIQNPNPFKFNSHIVLNVQFYEQLGSRDMRVYAPLYNYFL